MATGRIGTTPVLTTRWSKAPANGTTSLSGLDDNSVSLVYSVGYEQVYRNGTLLSRGNDYTATSGTSITLIDATVTGDIIEVFANATVALTDTYTQTQANGKFINNTLTTTTGDIIYASSANTPARLGIGSSGQVLTVASGIPSWAAASAPAFAGCSVEASGTSVSNATNTVILFDTERFDTDSFHSTSTNTGRITIPSGKNGNYLFSFVTQWTSINSTGRRYVGITKYNSSGVGQYSRNFEINPGSIAYASHTATALFNMVAGDYCTVEAYQASGGTMTITGNFDCAYLGA